MLIIARALAGGLFAAVIPASLVYIGDTVGIGTRQKALADLMAASAVGTALATVLGGLLHTSTAGGSPLQHLHLAGVALAVLLARLPEPKAFSEQKREGPLVQAGRVLVQPWALIVVGIALVEGAVILGFLYLPRSLESAGFSPAVAGLQSDSTGLRF